MAEETLESFDATDVAAEDNAKRDAKRRERQDADVLRTVMRAKEGRAWLYRQLESCHIYSSTFAPGQADVTAFQLGEENVGKRLMMAAIDASPDLYMAMIKDQRDEESRLNEVRRTERKNREAAEQGPSAEAQVAPLPPPAGYPGGPPLKRDKKK